MGLRSASVTFACLSLLLGVGARATQAQVFVVGMKTATEDAVTEFHPTHVEIPEAPLDEKGRLSLVRDLESEQGFAHRELPLGAGLVLLANGSMTPRNTEYRRMLYEKGQSAAAGDRVQISALQFKGDRIVIDFNGGPYAKHRFLSHLSLNDNPIAQRGPEATGCRVTLVFEGGIPEISAAEVKALLEPIVDFKAKTSLEAYADALPVKVREAVQAHEVLVGMDRRMVLASIGEPRSKHREHVDADNADSPMLEEWIYGNPPAATQFVRFKAGRVVRLEVAALGKPVEVHDRNEIGEDAGPVLQARTIVNGDAPANAGEHAPALPPTLRRPGETPDDLSLDQGARTPGKVNMPTDSAKHLVAASRGGNL